MAIEVDGGPRDSMTLESALLCWQGLTMVSIIECRHVPVARLQSWLVQLFMNGIP